MIDPNNQNKSRPLSEISHLFLSSLREQAGGEGRAKPVRIPPGQRAMTPAPLPPMREDVSNVFGEPERIEGEQPDFSEPRKRVTAIIGAHLTGQLNDAVLACAASLAAGGQRVGVMTVDAEEFKLQLVECDADVPASEPEVSDLFDTRQMSDVVLELNHDVDRWLLVVGDHRRPEARELLGRADDWTMLATCDHDGIVSGYRTLKGLAEGGKAPLSITLVDAPDEEQASRAFAKLASVCRQFLDWDVELATLEADVENAQAYTLLWCHSSRDKARLAEGPQWSVAEEFLLMTPSAEAESAHYGVDAAREMSQSASDDLYGNEIHDADHAFEDVPALANQPLSIPSMARPIPTNPVPPTAEASPMTMPTTIPFPTMSSETRDASGSSMAFQRQAAPATETQDRGHVDGLGEVIDLPDGVSVLSAVLRNGTQLIATPIAPPMCPGATVAVSRERGLVLVAQTGAGLAGMESIAAAVRWLDDSKQLIAMAMPQLAIDANAATQVQLLIDHSDRTAEGIRPLLGNSRITIRSYRRLRWAGRTGLLLDAA